jgi:non-specific serine/threonine protein kinase
VSDGTRVWLLGGITGVFGDISTAQPSRRVDVYDPTTDSWSSGPDLPVDAPKHHLSVALYAGRIYVLGGFDGILNQQPSEPFRPIAITYVLDGGTWRRIADAPLARGAATAQAIGSKIYVTGGAPTEYVTPYDELDIYDTTTDTWGKGAPMPTAREHLASCTMGGRFLVMGGWFGTQSTVTHAAEEYDPATDSWTRLPDLPTARGGLEAIDLDGTCRVIGGEDWALPPPGTFATQEGFDPVAGTWRTYAPMRLARHGFGLARQNGELFALGGGPSQGNSYSDDAEMYAP